jgi:acyl carrier protein
MAVRDIASDVRRVIRRQLNVDEVRVSPGAVLVDDLGADSLSLVELTLALEEAFSVDISDDEAARIRTVEDIVATIERHTNETASSSSIPKPTTVLR